MQLTFDWKFTALDRLIFMVYMYFHEKEAVAYKLNIGVVF